MGDGGRDWGERVRAKDAKDAKVRKGRETTGQVLCHGPRKNRCQKISDNKSLPSGADGYANL